MKKLLLTTFILFLGCSFLSASIQIRPKLGYGFGLGGQTMPEFKEKTVDATGKVTKNENIYYNGGAGLNMGLGIQYDFDPTMGLELVFSYVTSPTTEVGTEDNAYNMLMNASLEVSTSYIPIDLTFKLSTGKGTLVPYIGLGPSIAFNAKTSSVYKLTETLTATVIEEEAELTYKTGFGFNTCIGADYNITDSLSLNAGLIFRTLSMKLDKKIVTKQTTNGVDTLITTTTRGKETEYSEDDSGDDSTLPGSPKIENTYYFPFTSLTMNVGIAFKF